MNRATLEKVKTVWFVALGVLMYYFLNEVLAVGVHVTFRHVFALLIFGCAFLLFLIEPNLARGLVALRGAAIYSLPLLATTTISFFIWSVEQVDLDIIFRGISTSFFYQCMFSSALASASFLYVFGEKGIFYNLFSLLTANFLMLFRIILENGVGVFFSELVTLIVTFANVTGEVIVQAEIHELAFCLGAFLIYLLLHPQKSIPYFIFLFLSGFCFFAAFKRIGIFAVFLGLVFALFLHLVARIYKKSATRLIGFFSFAMFAILILYIWVIDAGLFEALQDAGLETTGRDVIYKAVSKYYTFSPEFLGHGIGYLTYQLNTNPTLDVTAVHNDFLQHFIDLGFFGYIIWLFSMSVCRILYFGRKGRTRQAILAFSLTVYLFFSSTTDNTMNYPLLTGAIALLMMGDGFDEEVAKTEEKLLGSVSLENQIQKKRRFS